MRIIITVFIFLLLISCKKEEEEPFNTDFPWKVPSKEGTITGLYHYEAAKLSIPEDGLHDADRFYADKSLRANIAFDPYAITKDVKDGIPRVKFHIDPMNPADRLVGAPYPHHYRAEFTRNPWPIRVPLHVEEWLGFSYIFPTEEEGFTQNQSPVAIYQNHPERLNGQPNNPPGFYIEIAFPDQLRRKRDPYYYTPLGGEIMICNLVRDIRWVAQGVRVEPGARLDFVIQIVYGLEDEGLLNVWINGELMTWPGNDKVPAGNIGSTVWPYLPVGGNSKLGLYHHQFKYEEPVQLNLSKGHTHMDMWMTDWNDLFREPTAWDYKNMNAYDAVDTSEYP